MNTLNNSVRKNPSKPRADPGTQMTNSQPYGSQQPLVQQNLSQRQYPQQGGAAFQQNAQPYDPYSQQKTQPTQLNDSRIHNQSEWDHTAIGASPHQFDEDNLYAEQLGPGSVQPNISSTSNLNIDPFLQKKGFCADFKQQNFNGYYFMPSSICVIVCNSILGIFLILLGIIVLSVSNSVVEIDTNYDHCPLNSYCSFAVNVGSQMKSPIYVYLKMDNYYQNHRR